MIRGRRLRSQVIVSLVISVALSRQYVNSRRALVLLRLRLYKEAMSEEEGGRPGTGTVVAEATPKVKKPPLYQVLLLNDDYTPMEFVVDVLERFFALGRTQATRIMLEVHTKGKGVCGVFTYEIAETKVAQVTTYARDHQHPLMCTLEAV